MKSFEKFNTEAMVHHIALEEGMSYEELSEQLAGDMPGGLGGAIMTGVVGAGGWALRNLKRSLTDTRPVFRDYGQSTVTKAQTSPNQPTGASGAEGSVTARRQAQRAARQQPTGSGSPTPEPPKPPKKPSLKSTAAALATAAVPAGSTRTAGADKADPHPMKTKPEGQVKVNPLFKQSKLTPEQETNKAAETIFKLKPGSLEKKPEPEKKEPNPPKPIVAKPEGKLPPPRPIPLNRRRTSPATTTTTGIPVY